MNYAYVLKPMDGTVKRFLQAARVFLRLPIIVNFLTVKSKHDCFITKKKHNFPFEDNCVLI